MDASQRIAQVLRDWLGEERPMDDETHHFIESTYGALGDEELAALLNGDDAEAVTLREFMLEPDEAVRMAVEAEALENQTDEADVAAALFGLEPVLAVRTALGVVRLPLDADDCRMLARRLRLGWVPRPELSAGAAEGLDEEQATRLLVRCRQRNLGGEDTPEAQARFLGDLARRSGSAPTFFTMFGRLAPLLSGLESDEAVYAGLQMHKATLARALRELQEFERDLKRSNMETMLLQGRRIPEISVDETRATIMDIDRACLAVFGRTEVLPDQAVMEADHGSFDPDEDLDRIFDIFG